MAWRADQDNPAVTAFRLMAAEYFANVANSANVTNAKRDAPDR